MLLMCDATTAAWRRERAASDHGERMSTPGNLVEPGWGVVRLKPSLLAGVFTEGGPDYAVEYGDDVAGSPDFGFVRAPDGPSI